MQLKTLRLKNFRNIREQAFVFHPEFNFIFGRNAQGKTNIIEAIYFLAELKSFRTTNRHDIISHGADCAKIQGVFEKDELSWDIDISLTGQERRVLLNSKKPGHRQDYYALIPLILFEPRHIYLFRDSPSERRRYMNRALYVQDVTLLGLFQDYDKVVAHKNRLLKEGAPDALLCVWNDRLISLASQIIYKRLRWMEQMSQVLTQEYRSISNSADDLRITYLSTVKALNDNVVTLGEQELAILLQEELRIMQHRERERRESLVGPHRDDFNIFVGERSVGALGSQGENRSVVIALKLSQLKLFAQKHQKTPLFVLDDVASGLDEERCRYLFDYLKKENTQAFLTTTDNSRVVNDFVGHATSFFVENGAVKL